ncbi:MAG: protein kinase [Acidobacteria bacterium]|nr:protein kinase [Acidobacteriota bacterium]
MIGRTLGHYRIESKLGEGGMGVVYKAQDLRLDRPVALKFLPPQFAGEEHKKRFIHEAKAASALDHPNICTIYEIGESEDGQMFIAMAYYQGETLKQKIEHGPMPEREAARIALQIALGLAKAHANGLVHRDVKPANVIVTTDGVAKIVDFGLAKVTGATELTRTGATLGTAAYMSPEQVHGESIDARSDVWALGVVLYEMLAGCRPFQGNHLPAIVYAIANEKAKPLRDVRPDLPEDLDRIVSRALQKNYAARYQAVSEMAAELEEWRASLTATSTRAIDFRQLWQTTRRPRIAVPALLILLAVAAGAGWWIQRASRVRWARQTAVPEAHGLADKEDYAAASTLAAQAERYIPGDPKLVGLWTRISIPLSVRTDPPGAEVYWKPYATPDGEWRHAGRSPLEGLRIPLWSVRLRLVKEGLVPVERVVIGSVGRGGVSERFTLDPEGGAPNRMVRVAAGHFVGSFDAIGPLGPVALPDYWIDKYEVNNREFKEFVDAGGYRERKYWANPFVRDGRVISWDQAMAEFHDATGRPGPATWEAGGFPSGQADFPVTGVSWYEAAAYASFAGKNLPTVYHWLHAAAVGRVDGLTTFVSQVLAFSNFRGDGPVRVGSLPGLGRYGTYDMAGNAREWCWNESRDAAESRRYILGGSWGEPTYRANDGDSVPPFDRSRANGFRCVKYIGVDRPPEALAAPIKRRFRDYSKEKQVSDEVFEVYKALYNYDKSELKPVVEGVDTSSDLWRREKVTFNAAYGSERVIAHLFLPKAASGPYQAVIYFPGSTALQLASSDNLYFAANILMDFVVRSGRAFVYPVYKGMHERRVEKPPNEPTAERDRNIQWRKDFGRTIDYLETRKEIDTRKLAYHGFSLGGSGPAGLLALENRVRMAVLEAGGLASSGRALPEADLVNFLPRIHIPVLMLNGRYDTTFPVEISQVPLFRLLGTPEKDKRHVILEGSHAVLISARNEVIRETLDWLDKYLGPVR